MITPLNDSSFCNQVVLVTGGVTGIGRATALAFGQAGATVIIAGRREAEGQETARLIGEGAGGGVGHFIRTDVSRGEEVSALLETIIARFGRLDCAFNNAGGAEPPRAFVDQSEEAFDQVMNTTVKGVWLCLKAEIAAMLKNPGGGGGAIVNMASIAGVIGTRSLPIYTASKHAVLGLTKAVALEFAAAGIRINAICPGAIETDTLAGYFRAHEAVKKQMIASHPIGRLGRPEEVAAAVLWLCSKSAGFLVGHPLVLDGGYTAQ